MQLRLAVDLRPLLEPFESGVTVYTKAMLAEFLRIPDIELDLFYQASKRSQRIHKLFPGVRHILISNTKFHFRSVFGFPKLPKGYFKEKPDLIWIPDRRPFYKTDIPIVMTIHDMVPEQCKWSLSLKSRLWHRIFSLKKLLGLCVGVIVPSSTVAAFLPQSIRNEVTFEGAVLSKKSEAPSRAKEFSKRPFFLSISPADPRKRLDWVLEMSKYFPKANFVIAGIKKKDKRFAQRRYKKRNNIFFLSSFSEVEKKWLLSHAKALLALSSCEGFDLPVLEAVRAKCPVIMSSIPVHHELYKSPECVVKDLDELRLAIHRALKGDAKVPKPRGDYEWSGAAKRASFFFRSVIRNKN